MNPASMLQLHPVAKACLDTAAASQLKRADYYRWVYEISRVGRSCKNDQTNIITNLIRPTQKVANLKDKIASLQKQLVATITGDFQITVFQYALRWTTIFQGDSLILTDVREYIYEAC